MFSEKPEVKISRQVLAPENQRSEKTIRFHLRETGAEKQRLVLSSEKPKTKISSRILTPENRRPNKMIRFHLRKTGAEKQRLVLSSEKPEMVFHLSILVAIVRTNENYIFAA
ncbi:hypothetical protein [Draconibacterium orientale]|uniref:hypothetical protein n=1 Tax=Draconibacterium orientale TaxID=1168034 RepID=UPI0029C01E52|nr:hypothetical protein [Draconibacterium orientale]